MTISRVDSNDNGQIKVWVNWFIDSVPHKHDFRPWQLVKRNDVSIR